MQAMGLVGIPYKWGGNTPRSGFDCSGLVRYVVENAADVLLPRTTSQMQYAGTRVEPDEIAPGDLVFFNTDGRPYSHVGVYVGNYRFVNAPSTGGTVRIDYVSNPYWARHFDGIRRIAGRRATAPVIIDPNAPMSPPETVPVIAPESVYAGQSQPTTPPVASDAREVKFEGNVAGRAADATSSRYADGSNGVATAAALPVRTYAAPQAVAARSVAPQADDPIGAVIARADRQPNVPITPTASQDTTFASRQPSASSTAPSRALVPSATVTSRYRAGTFADAASRDADDPIARIAAQAR